MGSIAIPIGSLTQHPVHRFLAKAKREGGDLQCAVRRAAVEVATIVDAATVAAAGDTDVDIEAGLQQTVKNTVREGHAVSIGAAGTTVSDYDGAATQMATVWRLVVDVEDDGSIVTVAPGMPAVSSAADLNVRLPGMEWKDVGVQVAQFGDGDFQNASVLGGNLVLRPSSILPQATIVIATTPDVT